MCWNRHGNIGGFFCVYLLLTLVAMLAVTSLVLQVYTWRLIADDGQGKLPYPGRSGGHRAPGEPELARQIRANLAQFQIENGPGPTVAATLENVRYGYHGDDRVWTLGVPLSIGNSNLGFYDTTTGQRGGYYLDVVHEGMPMQAMYTNCTVMDKSLEYFASACKVAGKNCRFTGTESYQSCWETSPDFGARGGLGIISEWYDACVGFSPSVIRKLAFDFSDSIVRQTEAFFFVLPGNPNNFNWQNLQGKRIGFPEGWYTDPDCIARNPDKIQGSSLVSNQIYFYRLDEIEGALQRGEVDAVFFADELEDIAGRLEIASDRITTCTVDGDALMFRKDSRIAKWFNPAFRTVLGSRQYREICKDIDDHYNTFISGRASESICRDR